MNIATYFPWSLSFDFLILLFTAQHSANKSAIFKFFCEIEILIIQQKSEFFCQKINEMLLIAEELVKKFLKAPGLYVVTLPVSLSLLHY